MEIYRLAAIKRLKKVPAYPLNFSYIPKKLYYGPSLLNLSDLGDLKHSMPGGRIPPPCLSLLLLEIWQPNLAQRLFIT